MTEDAPVSTEITIAQNRSESPAIIPPTDPESLSIAVRTQVEYYFSKENLRTDTFLQSKMDSQNAVPLATVMGFHKILALTRDTQVVIKSLESSNIVVLVDGKIKPKGSGRSTIILREIPSDSSEESIREIFNYPGAKPICTIRSEIGDTWFVSMESEEDAKDTIMDLKLKKRCFDNIPVKARLKTDAGLRSYYPTAPVIPIAYPGMPFQPYGIPLDAQTGYTYETAVAAPSTSPTTQNREKSGYRKENSDTSWGDNSSDGAYGNSGSRRDGKESRDRNSRNVKGHPTGSQNRKAGSGKSVGRDRKEGTGNVPPPVPIEINSAADFPPLHTQHNNLTPETEQLTSTVPAQPVVIPPRGFSNPYARYSIDEILHIVSGIKEAVLPRTIVPGQHPIALVGTPNTDLLLRQRTFSIDETKEQMQLGRPVQREAVLTGEVDYGSLIYGEDDHPAAPVAAPVVEQPEKKTPAVKSTGGSWAGVLMKSGAPAPADVKPPPSTPVKASPPPNNEKTPAPASTPSSAPKSEKKSSGDKKKTPKPPQDGAKKEGTPSVPAAEGKKGRNRRRAGSQGENNSKTTDEGEKSTPVPSSWGGRPTFANVLKQQEAEAAAEAAASPAPTVPPSAPVKTAPSQTNSNQQPRKQQEKGQKSQSQQGPNQQNTKKLMTNPDGTWVRDKLPPR